MTHSTVTVRGMSIASSRSFMRKVLFAPYAMAIAVMVTESQPLPARGSDAVLENRS